MPIVDGYNPQENPITIGRRKIQDMEWELNALDRRLKMAYTELGLIEVQNIDVSELLLHLKTLYYRAGLSISAVERMGK